jgi:hypothetical protein
MIGAGKLSVWKHWANFHLGLAMLLVPKTKQINSNFRRIHLLIFRKNKPNLEAKQEGFAVCSKATLGWRGGGKSLTLDYISRDTGISLRIDRTGGVSLGIIEISIIFCAQPMHGHVFIVSGRIQCIIVTNGHVLGQHS